MTKMSSAVNVPPGPRLTRSFWTLVPMAVKGLEASVTPLIFVISVTEVIAPFRLLTAKLDSPRASPCPSARSTSHRWSLYHRKRSGDVDRVGFRMPGVASAAGPDQRPD